MQRVSVEFCTGKYKRGAVPIHLPAVYSCAAHKTQVAFEFVWVLI